MPPTMSIRRPECTSHPLSISLSFLSPMLSTMFRASFSIALIILLTLGVSSCRKKCHPRKIKDADCECATGWAAVAATDCSSCEDPVGWYSHNFANGNNYVIQDTTTYENVFGTADPFEIAGDTLWFDSHTIVGMDRTTPSTSQGMDDFRTCLCVDPVNKVYLFKAAYAMKGQCKNGDKSLYYPSFWTVTSAPLDPTYSFQFEALQTNPD